MKDHNQLFQKYQCSLRGRYIILDDILGLLPSTSFVIGKSVLGEDIPAIQIGEGKTRILIWSQMHGNESTTTKAVMDLVNLLLDDAELSEKLRKELTLMIVPMLNPDGSKAYTRENANGIDLNRDFLQRTEPESNALIHLFEQFKPHYCFNMHDQRTIYGAGDTGKSATVSFLAPAFNENRDWNEDRTKAAELIVAMNDLLQMEIPGQVGRYDDSFNINCAGDKFQHLGASTILFEAGHYPDDYDREHTRRFIFGALVEALSILCEQMDLHNRFEDYLNIPQNKINFYDFVYQNVNLNYDGNKIITNFASQFKETLVEGKIEFIAEFAETSISENIFGHKVYDAAGADFSADHQSFPEPGLKADFFLGRQKFINGWLADY